jgi:outer membrane receptor protein involved in Fe transport
MSRLWILNADLRPAVVLALLGLLVSPPGGADGGAEGDSGPATVASEATAANEAAAGQGTAWKEQIVVTASRSEESAQDVPFQVTVVDPAEPAAATDFAVSDLVSREVPSLNLHVSSSSLVVSPRDQSLSFRGVGSGSVSRALLLVDGLPMLDPYNNSAIWSKVPIPLIERVEVVPGGGATVWGNLALSGVVNLITRPVSGRALDFVGRLAERSTGELTTSWADAAGRWSGRIALDTFTTDGYLTAEPATRGPADEEEFRQFDSLTAQASYAVSASALLQFRLLGYREDRGEGSRLDRAEDDQWMAAVMADLLSDPGRSWQLRVFARRQLLDDFTGSISADRTTVAPSSHIFDLTSDNEGASAVWNRARGERLTLAAGADLQFVAIDRQEDLDHDGVAFTRRYLVEGKQRLAGGFVEGSWRVGPRATFQLATRADSIRTYGGHSRRAQLPDGALVEDERLDTHTESTINPRLGFVVRATPASRLRGAVYTGFRAPAPSELFVGAAPRNNRETAPNPGLAPEKLTGGELGWDFGRSNRFSAQATAFWSETRDLIDRITLGRVGSSGGVVEPCGFVGPGGSCTQRQNIGKARARGVELDSELRPHPRWRIELGAALLETEILENVAVPALVGNELEHTPHDRVTLGITYSDPRQVVVALRARRVGERWAEPENEHRLRAHTLCDLTLSHAFSKRLEIFGGVENFLDTEYRVDFGSDGFAIGPPRIFQVGVRFRSRGAE